MEGPRKKRWAAWLEEAGSLSRSIKADENHPEDAGSAEAGHLTDESTVGAGESRVLSRKALAKALRRQAYQRAKLARAADPKHQAMKEAAKQRRREAYRQAKERHRAREAELSARQKTAEAEARAEAKRQLAERVRNAVGRGSEPGRALALDVERALQSADVRDLMERLRAESATLAARHRESDGG